MSIKNNTTSLQNLLNDVNTLPTQSDVILQDKLVLPTTESQTIKADNGYDGLNEIIVGAIPDEYITTIDATAISSEILSTKTAYVNGEKITGTMSNNGAISQTMDGINTKSISIPSGYTSGGSVSLDNTIDNEVDEQADLIAQIKDAVNNLPEAGGGGEVETVICQIVDDYESYPELTVVTSKGVTSIPSGTTKILTVVKNTYITIYGDPSAYIAVRSGQANVIVASDGERETRVLYVEGNCDIRTS